jgi:hypothetical protein
MAIRAARPSMTWWSWAGTTRQVHRAIPCQPTGSINGPGTALKASCRVVPARWLDWPSVPLEEPSKLYGSYAPVIVPKTSDGYAYVPDNLKSLSGVLRKPKSSTFYNAHRINKGVITTLQHVLLYQYHLISFSSNFFQFLPNLYSNLRNY